MARTNANSTRLGVCAVVTDIDIVITRGQTSTGISTQRNIAASRSATYERVKTVGCIIRASRIVSK